MAEVDPDATAYSRRDVPHELNVNAVWLPHETIGDAETAWAREFIADLEPHHAGVYLNFLDGDDHDRTAAASDRRPTSGWLSSSVGSTPTRCSSRSLHPHEVVTL